MPYFSRRTVLSNAAGAAVALPTLAAAALPAVAKQSAAFSPEYWACYHRRIELERLHAIGGDENEQFYAVVKTAYDACSAAKEALVQRGVEGLLDIVAFLRVDHWQSGNFVHPQDYMDRDQERMLRAVEKLVGVEPWEVPTDLVRLVAEQEAREAALRAELEAARACRRNIVRVNIDRDYVYKPDEFESRNWQSEHLDEVLTPENVKIGHTEA
jgi:hypothetical protein